MHGLCERFGKDISQVIRRVNPLSVDNSFFYFLTNKMVFDIDVF